MRQLAMLSALSLVACGSDEAMNRAIAANRLISAAEERVTSELRDPGSADFSDVTIPHEGVSTVCGRVNARNGFGGMTGPQRFVVRPERVFLEEREEAVLPGSFANFWREMCS